ncbi:MAG TPA: amidohydrolase, partial [Gemmatimonadaceae bacterium]
MRLRSVVAAAAVACSAILPPPTSLFAQGAAPANNTLPLTPTRTLNLDTDEGTWISLDVSPDGKTIVFDLMGDLYTMPVTGGTATQLTKGLQYDAQPRYSPDGKSIVFTSDKDGGDNVWTIDVATKALKQITKGKQNRYRSPEWAPDGNYIVVSRAGAPIGTSKPWMFHKDGGSGFQLVRDPAPLNGAFQVSLLGAAFGKDDRYIWFAQRNGAWEYNAAFPQYTLVTLDRQTGRRETRANLLGGAIRPALSPDGKWLVYGSRYEAQTGLRIRDMESGDEKWLAYPVQRDEQESVASMDALPGFSFTPDSKSIIASYGGKIWNVPVDGSGQTAIPFHVQAAIDMGPKLAFKYPVSDSADFVVKQIRDAVPSPDGKQLAFVSLDKLYTMDYPAGTPRRVTSLEGNEAQPAWSADGKQLAFVSWGKDGGHVYKVQVPGGRPIQVTQARSYYSRPVWSPDMSRIVVTRAPAQSVLEQGG